MRLGLLNAGKNDRMYKKETDFCKPISIFKLRGNVTIRGEREWRRNKNIRVFSIFVKDRG